MCNYINTERVLLLTLSKVKLTLMILLCSRALAVLINASGERARGMVCVGTGIYCARVKLCPSTHTWRQQERASTNIQQELCIFFGAVPHSINCSYRAVPGLRLPVWTKSVCTDIYPGLPSMAQHGSAWHSRTWQCCWALKVSMPLHKFSDKPSCKSGFRLCIAGGHQWGIELHPWFCLPPSVAVHLTFVLQKIYKNAVQSCSAAPLHSTLFVDFYISKPTLISAHISSL